MDRNGSGMEKDLTRRLAAVDIGSNTLLLRIVELRGGNLHSILDIQRVAGLGRTLRQTGRLRPENVRKALNILSEYRHLCEAQGAKVVLPVATAAVREARNGGEFLKAVKREVGWTVRLISGEEEARLTYLGALSNKSALKGTILVIDIGGGSTEFIWGSPPQWQGRVSLPTGSVKLKEEHLKSDPPTETEWEALEAAVGDNLAHPALADLHPNVCVGTSGTVTTLAAMELKMSVYNGAKLDGFRLGRNSVTALLRKMAAVSSEQRLKMPGLTSGREDVILAGAFLLEKILEKFHLPEILVSDRGLRFGLIWDYLRREGDL